jgi:hypothetical protein
VSPPRIQLVVFCPALTLVRTVLASQEGGISEAFFELVPISAIQPMRALVEKELGPGDLVVE